jgi:hypothetical protein
VANGTGEALTGLRVQDTILRTGRIIEVPAPGELGILPPEGRPMVAIFTDEFKHEVRLGGDQVAVVVSAGGRSTVARYEFGTDGCHVRKLAGPDTLVLE